MLTSTVCTAGIVNSPIGERLDDKDGEIDDRVGDDAADHSVSFADNDDKVEVMLLMSPLLCRAVRGTAAAVAVVVVVNVAVVNIVVILMLLLFLLDRLSELLVKGLLLPSFTYVMLLRLRSVAVLTSNIRVCGIGSCATATTE